MNRLIDWAERGLLPDAVIRWGIRRLLTERLRLQAALEGDTPREPIERLIEESRKAPIAQAVDSANRQHYEAPTEFFRRVLGPRMKYSSAFWPTPETTLDQAEEAMLELFCDRAELRDGMEVLDLGCGWGSLSLWIAERYPNCRITAVSNSRTQREYIQQLCRKMRIDRIEVITGDINEFQPSKSFDRVLSVEMFEHVRNHQALLKRIATWLRPQGKLAVHIFCHRHYAYYFETEGVGNWMGRHFFTGGMMPSDDWLARFQDDLILEHQWRICGKHYARTLEAWRARCDAHRRELVEVFRGTDEDAARLLQRWRIFFMACAELFAFEGGRQWYVSHYLFRRRSE